MKNFSILAVALLLALAMISVAPTAFAAKATCFEQFLTDSDDCTYRSSWIERAACEADAEITLAGCVRRTILG